MAVASIFKRPFDLLMVVYFITHIPTTILVDSQAVFPKQYYPQWALQAMEWHIETNGDTLMRDMPAWFQGLVWVECFLQLPFFVFATYAFIHGKNWIRIPALVYAVEVVTSMISIMGEILAGPSLQADKRQTLALIYCPYLLLPLALATKMALSPQPFGAGKAKTQ